MNFEGNQGNTTDNNQVLFQGTAALPCALERSHNNKCYYQNSPHLTQVRMAFLIYFICSNTNNISIYPYLTRTQFLDYFSQMALKKKKFQGVEHRFYIYKTWLVIFKYL